MGGILVVLVGGILLFTVINKNKEDDNKKDNGEYSFTVDSENKYEIVTDSRFITLMNDGGSNTNVYYQIDLDNNKVIKKSEDYKANLGGTPTLDEQTLYTKNINSELKNETKKLLDELIEKEDKKGDNYSFYVITHSDGDKEIYNTDSIKKLRDLLVKIDEFEN